MPDDLPIAISLSAYQVAQDGCFTTEDFPVFAKLAHADTCTMPHLPARTKDFAI